MITEKKMRLPSGFLLGVFRGAKSIVMQISFVMILFSDQISGSGKSFRGTNCLRGASPAPLPPWKKASHSEKVEMDYWEHDHLVDREIMPHIIKLDDDSDGDSIFDDEEDDEL